MRRLVHAVENRSLRRVVIGLAGPEVIVGIATDCGGFLVGTSLGSFPSDPSETVANAFVDSPRATQPVHCLIFVEDEKRELAIFIQDATAKSSIQVHRI